MTHSMNLLASSTTDCAGEIYAQYYEKNQYASGGQFGLISQADLSWTCITEATCSLAGEEARTQKIFF
jgi:hypothetical protein